MVHKQIGIQLWSLRNAMEVDVDDALQKVAQVGYTFVELAGHNAEDGTFHKVHLRELKKKIADRNMRIYSAHCDIHTNNAEKVCWQAAEAGLKYIIRSALVPQERQSIDSYKRTAEAFNAIGDIAKKYGLQFGFHNHAQEFEPQDGQIPYDILLSHTNPETVVFQMDLGWVVFANQQPQQYFQKYPGRFPLWHLRDLHPDTKETVGIGKGVIDFASSFKSATDAGFLYGIVEFSSRDQSHVFDNMSFSHKYLTKAEFFP